MNVEHVLHSHFCFTNRPIFVNAQTYYLPECSYPQIPKICDLIQVTLLKMEPHYSKSSRVTRKCPPPHPQEDKRSTLLASSRSPSGLLHQGIREGVRAKKKKPLHFVRCQPTTSSVFIKSFAITAIIGLSVLERCLCLSSKD